MTIDEALSAVRTLADHSPDLSQREHEALCLLLGVVESQRDLVDGWRSRMRRRVERLAPLGGDWDVDYTDALRASLKGGG